MFVCLNEKKLLIFMFTFICWLLRKKKYKELELAKLEFHIRRNSSLVHSSTIEEKKKSIILEFCIYKELELGKSSIVLHETRVYHARVPCGIFSPKKSHQHKFFIFIFMNLECLKLDLHSKLEFHELEFQKVVLLLFCKQWYVANNFCEKW